MSRYSFKKTPSEVLKEIANKHRVLRKNLGYSQAEIAERSEVSLGSVKRFETTGKISLESFFKLLMVLDRLDEMENILIQEENSQKIENLFSKNIRK